MIDKNLTVEIIDDEIRISIGIDTMMKACEFGPFDDAKVLDAHSFAVDVLAQLQKEEEDGTTAVHQLLDKAMQDAIEEGSEHVVFPSDDFQDEDDDDGMGAGF